MVKTNLVYKRRLDKKKEKTFYKNFINVAKNSLINTVNLNKIY